jgi:hypothetical protein
MEWFYIFLVSLNIVSFIVYTISFYLNLLNKQIELGNLILINFNLLIFLKFIAILKVQISYIHISLI